MKVFKIITINLVLIISLFSITELFFSLGDNYNSRKNEYYKIKVSKYQQESEDILGRWGFPNEIAMPYFGYGVDYYDYADSNGLFTKDVNMKINNYKFLSSVDYPYVKKSDEVVIGVFGGSFAFNWVVFESGSNQFSQKLPKLIPELKNKKIILVNMSQGGFKQPQQFFVFAYFYEMFDAAIFIDGYNEVLAASPDDFPIEFPIYSAKFYSMSSAKNEFRSNMAEDTKSLRKKLVAITALQNKHPWLARSYLFYMLDSSISSYLKNKIVSNNLILQKDIGSGNEKFYKKDFGIEERFALASKVWSKYTAMSHDLAKIHKIKLFHYLQPNQYLDAKPLSAVELKNAFDPEAHSHVKNAYSFLFSRLKEMEKAKYKVSTQLVNVFSNSKEDLYIDVCCHVNNTGNAILTTDLLGLISADWNRQ